MSIVQAGRGRRNTLPDSARPSATEAAARPHATNPPARAAYHVQFMRRSPRERPRSDRGRRRQGSCPRRRCTRRARPRCPPLPGEQPTTLDGPRKERGLGELYLACHPSAATAVADASPVRAGAPVALPMTWCPLASTRVSRDVVATAPERTLRIVAGSSRRGAPTPTSHPASSGEAPSTRTSPPRFTHVPRHPPRAISTTTRSAARPLPMPPGSKPTPSGIVIVPPAGSTMIAAAPRSSRASVDGSPAASTSCS